MATKAPPVKRKQRRAKGKGKKKPFPNAAEKGVSVVAYRDYPLLMRAFLAIQQAFCRYWPPGVRTKKQVRDYGAFCASTSRIRARRFFQHFDYFFWVGCNNAEPELYADAMLSFPLFPKTEDEFWEEVLEQGGWAGRFFGRFNLGIFNFGKVGYVYYVLKRSLSSSTESMFALFDRVVKDLRDAGCDCLMTDLPIKIAGEKSLDLPRITQLAIRFGFRGTGIYVFDNAGNVWQQYCLVLRGRPVMFADKLRDAGHGFTRKEIENSGAWKQLCDANSWDQATSRIRLDEFLKSATSQAAFLNAYVGVAA